MGGQSGSEKVTLKTGRFGSFEVNKSAVMELVGGIIGFPGFTKFVLLEYNPPFSWLHSAEHPELAFVVVSASEFGDNYLFPLPIGDRDTGLKTEDEVAILNLVSVRPNPRETTVNLKAPVIVNLTNMKGKQLVLDDPRLSVRFPLFESDDSEGKV